MNKRVLFSLVTIILIMVFLFSSGMTLASWRTEDSTVNSITMGSVSGHIIEEYNQGQTVSPSATVTKKVQVENTGTMDVIVRVKIEKAWGDYRDSDGKLKVNPTLSTDNILITYNTNKWLYRDDGYFYFKDVLKPGEITPTLFDSFTVDGETTCGEYKNKTADIIVTAELVQAAYHGLSYWGMSFLDLGTKYIQTTEIPIVTTVKFNNPTLGFSFDVNNGDLFANFKNLVPGDSRSQVITVTNNWNKETEIFLNADYIEQSKADEKTYKLVEKLLRESTIITVSDSQGNVIYSGYVYGNYDVESVGDNSMKYPISLGKFKAGQTKNLYVSLSLSKDMDNEYKNLLGLIKWVFSAEGSESDMYIPVTGDENNTTVYACITIISAVILVVLLLDYKKKFRKI